MSIIRFQAGELTFEWSAAKAASNKKKHGVSFEEAATVFNDPLARFRDRPDLVDGEERHLLVGHSEAQRLLVVVHVERGFMVRIISARRLTARERVKMEEG